MTSLLTILSPAERTALLMIWPTRVTCRMACSVPALLQAGDAPSISTSIVLSRRRVCASGAAVK